MAKVAAVAKASVFTGLLGYRFRYHAVQARQDVATTVSPDVTKTLQERLATFSEDSPGCAGLALDLYHWRAAGYGSNLNNLLPTWIDAILEGRDDVAVVLDTDQLFRWTTCSSASNGTETGHGWPCVFAPVPHLCMFHSRQEWIDYNRHQGISGADEAAMLKRSQVPRAVIPVRSRLDPIQEAIEASMLTIFGVVARLLEHLHSHLQPWFRADVNAILREPDIGALGAREYVSMHVRRGDTITTRNGRRDKTETETYFQNVVKYLEASPGGLTATDIKGIWVSTDGDVMPEVKMLAPTFFPNVQPECIVSISDRVELKRDGQPQLLAQDRNRYEAMVLLRAELEMMASAAVFSGTFSSNISRLVALMRHSLGKPEGSALSADFPRWTPG